MFQVHCDLKPANLLVSDDKQVFRESGSARGSESDRERKKEKSDRKKDAQGYAELETEPHTGHTHSQTKYSVGWALIDWWLQSIVIADFGIAKHIENTMRAGKSGDREGTLQYMAPELLQVFNRRQLSH